MLMSAPGMQRVTPAEEITMSDERDGVGRAQEAVEKPVRSPATHPDDLSRPRAGGSGLQVRMIALLTATIALGMAACTSEIPTQPETAGDPTPAAPAFALASNTWTLKAAYPGQGLFGSSAGMVPNSAGQSIVYLFGGTDGQGGTGFHVQAYNVATNAWTTKASRVFVFNSNGVGKIGSKLYFSGGYEYSVGYAGIVFAVYAYDPAADQMIRKADMPKATADGVTGVIDGKLYVLAGTCSGELWPDPRYCEQEPIRRLFRYDPATNTWVGRASAPHFHKRGAGGLINGKFYVVFV